MKTFAAILAIVGAILGAGLMWAWRSRRAPAWQRALAPGVLGLAVGLAGAFGRPDIAFWLLAGAVPAGALSVPVLRAKKLWLLPFALLSCGPALAHAQTRDSIVRRDTTYTIATDPVRDLSVIVVRHLVDTVKVPVDQPPPADLPQPLPADLDLAQLTAACRSVVVARGVWYRPNGTPPEECHGLYAPQGGNPQPPPPDSTPSQPPPPPPPPPTGGPQACTGRPGWPLMTYQEFDTPISRGSIGPDLWTEEAAYSPPLSYSNGVVTGTWRKGLLGGRGPFNFGYRGTRHVVDMYLCFSVKLASDMTIPNNRLKDGFWHGGGVNHVFMFRSFPDITAQYAKVTGPDGYPYETTEYCRVPGSAGTATDHSVYTVRPTHEIELRDGKWHVLEYKVQGGTPAHGDGALEVREDGKVVCQTTGVRWYHPTMPGYMTGIDFNPNSSGGGSSSGPVKCPRPVDDPSTTADESKGNAAWCTTETVDYGLVYAEGQ